MQHGWKMRDQIRKIKFNFHPIQVLYAHLTLENLPKTHLCATGAYYDWLTEQKENM